MTKIKISLIVSTYGRYVELEMLLESFLNQDCNLSDFEVIIVDQNDVLNLDPLVENYKDKLKIVHFKSKVKGLSKAKNKGIELSKGAIITFPDDDCTYYPDTVSKALNYFSIHPDVDVVYGSVFDRTLNKGIMRNWSNNEIRLNLLNFSVNYSAITCFTKLKITFDENFGVGSKISSGEELDYVIRAISDKKIVVYTPEIQVWHPELNVSTMDERKVYEYSYGYGAIMRKNLNFKLLIVFLMSLAMQMLHYISGIITEKNSKRTFAIKGRIAGFFQLKHR